MALLDRFRTQSRDKHPDPAVRLAFVDELPLDDRTAIAAVAREDEDPRVRRAAVSKLMVPATLAAIAREDGDDGVRAQAAAMLRDIALEAFEDTGESDSLEAVAAITDARVLMQVAKGSARAAVGLAALARIDDPRMLGSVARHAVVDATRTGALDVLVARGERGEILAVAMNSDFKDTALGALSSIGDRSDLDLVIARGKNKSAVKRARTVVRETEEQAAREAAARAEEEALTADIIAANPALLEPELEIASPPHGDPLAAHVQPEPLVAGADASTTDDEPLAEERRLALAQAEAEAREAAEQASARTRARLAELVEEAAVAAADQNLPLARKRFAVVGREWHALNGAEVADDVLKARFTEIDVQMTTRESEARETDARVRREHLTRVTGLLSRVESVAAKPDQTLKAVDRAMRDVRAMLGSVPSLPTKQDFDDVTRRLKAVQSVLTPRVQELREADDWKRFANAAVQEQLCLKMEALRALEDPDKLAAAVRDLQSQWRDAADVPRAQADALWRRFKTAHDEVWTRCEAHFAAQAAEREANLARKTALCEAAESLSASTKWLQTAEDIKKLQAEWKTIGAVSRGKERAIWERFRTACDRFFSRRHDDMAERKALWAANLAKKDALSARAEELAASTDWDAAATEIKKLQAEWKTVGPVKKTRSEAVWQRFRGACDAFFARYAQRHDVARAERVTAREAICAELDALATAEALPPDLATVIRTLRGRWQQELAARGVDPQQARALDERFATAFAAVIARWPTAFAGTDLDPDANRKRMEALVNRVEAIASSLAAPAASDARVSSTARLASMLKEALAANTIGGKIDDEHRFRAAAEELRDAQAAWSRVGLVPDTLRRPLSDRFQRAARSISDRVAQAGEAGRSAQGVSVSSLSRRS